MDFYIRKADRLQQRWRELEAELTAVQAELAKACTARDQLAEPLDEILAQAPGIAEEQEAESPAGSNSDESSKEEPPASARAGERASFRQEPGRGKAKTARPKQQASGAKSGEVMRAIEQLLATSGKPMHVKDLTAALGRPTEGRAGTAAETIRATCKRLAGHGRIAEVKTAVFAIARASGAGAADESGDEAGLKGAG
ncbi:hypothetical protein [Streptomyces hawaiiensis]|uniref:hypothetical protein n=1 Tax=Streptomyces hawaiiensis TaxID=67305 RepID=UPI0036621379